MAKTYGNDLNLNATTATFKGADIASLASIFIGSLDPNFTIGPSTQRPVRNAFRKKGPKHINLPGPKEPVFSKPPSPTDISKKCKKPNLSKEQPFSTVSLENTCSQKGSETLEREKGDKTNISELAKED
ncbi:hypothetical protein PanWU01x14_286470 [Parasponia andersonii]|uniref:Uncharacterized protein n=1 Tax=Parasponia andersonii TaxID=3476 RepID=A0A2P5AZ86_PARAD|nr:hypothetical protein PanWU01x14_286470 [Parasponia andersonii]